MAYAYCYEGDTLNGVNYFKESVNHYDKILDTLSKSNKHYGDLLGSKAMDLLVIGKKQEGLELLQQVYVVTNNDAYKYIIDSSKDKTSQQLLENLIKGSPLWGSKREITTP